MLLRALGFVACVALAFCVVDTMLVAFNVQEVFTFVSHPVAERWVGYLPQMLTEQTFKSELIYGAALACCVLSAMCCVIRNENFMIYSSLGYIVVFVAILLLNTYGPYGYVEHWRGVISGIAFGALMWGTFYTLITYQRSTEEREVN